MAAFTIALLGAESTGKTTLAHALHEALAAGDGALRVAVVGEALREFCDRYARTPRRDEQVAIAAEQTRRIAEAAAAHDVIVADTTALMTAVYSEHVFGDDSLYAAALEAHARTDLTLLCATDLPWQADGHQRDGPDARAAIDALLRAALGRAGNAYSVISGHGPERLAAALACVQRARNPPREGARWQWVCERCGDAACERHLLPRDNVS